MEELLKGQQREESSRHVGNMTNKVIREIIAMATFLAWIV